LEKRRLLNFVVSNCTWSGCEPRATLHEPFYIFEQTTAMAAQSDATRVQNLADHPGMLGVKPQEVVPGQAETADGWLLGEASMGSMPIVTMEPGRERVTALI